MLPPCCTNSVLRERGSGQTQGISDGGPRPIRGRTGLLRFGLPTNTVSEQRKVEDHTVLIVRFLTLHHIADEFNPCRAMCALENPQDPMTYLPESRLHDEIPSLWAWPEIAALLEGNGFPADPRVDSSNINGEADAASGEHSWFLAQFDQGALGHAVRKPTAVLTNSWELFQTLHERRGTGTDNASVSTVLSERIRTSSSWAKWAVGLCDAIGRAVRGWITSSREERRESESEGRATLRALTQREMAFRKHCEEGHIVFRRDCRACLEGQMRSHVHRRQQHHGSNTFCLSMDLVGPWRPGKDHILGQPATRFLIASLSVPLVETSGAKGATDQPEEEGDHVEPSDAVEIEEYERGEEEEEEGGDGEQDPGPAEMDRRRREGEEAWRRTASKLQEPVPVHDLIFCEPLCSKRSAEVLRAVQRIWVKILGLGLTVRRLHTDGGREFCNRQLDAWALARDLHHTYSVASDPKSNGRIENWVKHAKSGIRTLLCSQKEQGAEHWPSALRQWTEQRLRRSLKILHVPDPIRPLPPFGAQVLVKK